MSGSNRSTQEDKHPARSGARGATVSHFPAPAPTVPAAPFAPRVDSVRQERAKTDPASAPTDRTDPASVGTHRLASEADLAGTYVPCPGPAGLARSWPCAHADGFGHLGDHERFAREQIQKEAIATDLRASVLERDVLLDACRRALASVELGDLLDGRPGRYRPIKEILREAINKVTR